MILLISSPGCFWTSDTDRSSAESATVEESAISESEPEVDINLTPLDLPLIDPEIIIWKSERRIELYSDDELVREWPLGLGFAPEGDKEKQGDGRTPEGEFYICIKNPQSSFYLSLGISYPSLDDAESGLQKKLITQDEYNRIEYAINHKLQPPWNTALGGEIFIHGHGSSSDWTLGCIAMDDDAIEELYEVTPVGTKVTITQ